MFNLPLLVSLACGFGLPAYKTITAIEQEDKPLQEQCLKYWTVFSLFYFFHILLEFFLQYLPLYYYLHALFVVVIATQPLLTDTIFKELKARLPPALELVKEHLEQVKAMCLGQN